SGSTLRHVPMPPTTPRSPGFRHPLHLRPALLLRPTLVALGVAASCAAMPAFARDADAGDPGTSHEHGVTDLDAIRVRATPIARTAEDLARPVAVLAGERLDEAKAASIGETVARLPGVQSSFFGAGVGRPVIRGL